MGKTSIYLSSADVEFVLTKGSNVSEGVRRCIDFTRDADGFKRELREIVGDLRVAGVAVELPSDVKGKILGIMEDD